MGKKLKRERANECALGRQKGSECRGREEKRGRGGEGGGGGGGEQKNPLIFFIHASPCYFLFLRSLAFSFPSRTFGNERLLQRLSLE